MFGQGSPIRAVAASIPLLVAAVPLGCGGAERTSSAPDASTVALPDAGTVAPDPGAVVAACDDLFSAFVACGFVVPAAAVHEAPIFRKYCESWVSLPGSKMNVATIECDAQAYRSSCSSPAACSPEVGTLRNGAPCNYQFHSLFASAFQCQGGTCVPLSFDAGWPNCGTCASVVPLGQPCSQQGPGCAPGTGCNDVTCLPNTPWGQVPVGGKCSDSSDCAVGPCVGGTCRAQGTAGDSCEYTGYADDIPGSPCVAGLVCDWVSSTCVAPSVPPGGTCGGSGQICIFGSCAGGLCPTLIPEGQPCPTNDAASMCEPWTVCDNTGKCVLPDSTVCR